MTEISERHEVRVRGRDKSFLFLAEPQEGRLVIREEEDEGDELCALTLADPEELAGFFEGLRRVLDPPPPPASPAPGETEPDRDELVTQARRKNANAFTPWSRAEEAEVRQRFERGETVEQIARDHQRSPRRSRCGSRSWASRRPGARS